MILQKKLASNYSDISLGVVEESRVRNERQTVFQLVRDLAYAQFEIADKELTYRLWREVADRGINIDRIINLLYGCSFYDDDFEMTKTDEGFQAKFI